VIKEEFSVQAHFAVNEMTRVFDEVDRSKVDEILLLLQQFSDESETSTSVQYRPTH
jgi:hypothetical protein